MFAQNQIDTIINKIVINYQPEKIYLFGSYAKGCETKDSDVDLCIVKESDLPMHRRGREVRKYLYHSFVPIDILVYTPKEFEECKNDKYSFVYEINLTGKLLYAR